MKANEVIEALAALATLGNLPFDPGAGLSFELTLPEGGAMDLEIDPEGGSLLFSASLFAVPEDDRSEVLERAMRWNHLHAGMAFGWDATSGFLVLSALVPLPLLDEEGFLSVLDAFATRATALRAGLPAPEGSASHAGGEVFPLAKA